MLDVVRQYVDAALGALPKDRAMELASELLEQGASGREQVTKLANDLMEWSRSSVERVADLVRTEVRKQVGALGLATKEDLDEVRQRLWKLEGAAAPKRAPAKRAPAKRAARKGAGTKRGS
jgi:polyhydroxyalkanoate synthesis regulator phasin